MSNWQRGKVVFPSDPGFAEMMARGEIASGADANEAYHAICSSPYLDIPPEDRAELLAMIEMVKTAADRAAATEALNLGDMKTLCRYLRAAGAY